MKIKVITCSFLLSLLLIGIPGYIFSQSQPLLLLENHDFDLDGDGKKDQILFCFYSTTGYSDEYNRFTIEIGRSIIAGKGDNLDGKFEVVDVDTTDRFREIIVPESGPSDDYGVYVFRFDGSNILYLGYVPGHLHCRNEVVFDGSGIVKGTCRANILQTWWYRCEFKVNENQKLECIDKDFYEMKPKVRVTLKLDLALKKSPSDTTTVWILHPGDHAILIGSDNKRWCLVETESGLSGWFAVEGFSKINGRWAQEVFDGLLSAD